MYDMGCMFGYCLESFAQERWIDWEALKFGNGELGKGQLPLFFNACKRIGLRIEIRIGREGDQEIECERVMGCILVGEEVLDHVEQTDNGDIDAEFFAHFACEGFGGSFAQFGTTSWGEIEVSLGRVFEQDAVVVGGDGC